MSQSKTRNAIGDAPVVSITCEEVIKYQKVLLSNGTIPEEIQSAVVTHTAVCPTCRGLWIKGTDKAPKDAKPN